MESPLPPNPPPSAANHNPPSAANNGDNNKSGNYRKFFKTNNSISNRPISMLDTESQYETFHSPLRSESPLRSDDPASKQIVSVDKYFSPLRSPKKPCSENSSFAPTPPPEGTPPLTPLPTPSPGVVVLSRSVRDGVPPGVEKLERGMGEEVGGERRSRAAVDSILRRSKRDVMVKKAALVFRVCQLILSLIAFSVMAADKTQGWSGDSYDRYKEYRYLVAVNVIGFVYAGFQACDLAYYLSTGNHAVSIPLRYHFDFSIDQILAYLLMSASSSAATRVDDWVLNWGKDEFTEMASASISMSFLAFFAFALSSLICGYSLCNREST